MWGDIATTREDLEQEGLLAAAGWISRHEEDLAALASTSEDALRALRGMLYGVIKTGIFSHLKKINRDSGRAFSASDWIENIGECWGHDDVISAA